MERDDIRDLAYTAAYKAHRAKLGPARTGRAVLDAIEPLIRVDERERAVARLRDERTRSFSRTELLNDPWRYALNKYLSRIEDFIASGYPEPTLTPEALKARMPAMPPELIDQLRREARDGA